MAQLFADFVTTATKIVDVAIYDFRLSDPVATTVVGALCGAAARGLVVRIAYDAGKPATVSPATFAALQADPAPPGTATWVTEHFGGSGVLPQTSRR